MADSETEQYGALVDRLAGDYPDVPQQVVEEQVVKAVEGTQLFGQVPTSVEIVETIATENVSRVDRAVRGGADVSEDEADESQPAGEILRPPGQAGIWNDSVAPPVRVPPSAALRNSVRPLRSERRALAGIWARTFMISSCRSWRTRSRRASPSGLSRMAISRRDC